MTLTQLVNLRSIPSVCEPDDNEMIALQFWQSKRHVFCKDTIPKIRN